MVRPPVWRDNPRAKARGLSLHTGRQTMLYLSHKIYTKSCCLGSLPAAITVDPCLTISHYQSSCRPAVILAERRCIIAKRTAEAGIRLRSSSLNVARKSEYPCHITRVQRKHGLYSSRRRMFYHFKHSMPIWNNG